MIDEQELQAWRDALAEEPAGWDFSTLTGYREEEPPWRWRTLVENLAAMSDRVLDLGTGGGEVLASLADVLPAGTLATEGWPPNVPVARERLAPLGIEVLEHDPDDPDPRRARVPVPDASFDLILDRHESFDAHEIARVLAPGGAFLTQQVGGDDAREIGELFGHDRPFGEVTLENAVHDLVAAGLRVDRADAFHGRYEFDDVPVLLRSLRRVPWDAPADLDADRHRELLEELHARTRRGPFVATVSRFLVLARAPEPAGAARVDFATLPRDELDVPRV
ncbi:class I SAM-dependent methyltransferase [Brachybacterium sp. AOP43-C2-M15]|uniref:class I SAM-dependent methyltransferase n=1 Tax=Brachybacterium sp. AOP43-C2-M15 TaxID=3457661 RepID=UPI004033ABCC